MSVAGFVLCYFMILRALLRAVIVCSVFVVERSTCVWPVMLMSTWLWANEHIMLLDTVQVFCHIDCGQHLCVTWSR